MNRTRTVARTSLSTFALAAGVLGFAAPATAGGGDSVTINHQQSLTIHSSQPMQIAAMARATCPVGVTDRTVRLTLTGPAGAHSTKQTLASEQAPCNGDDRLDTALATPSRNGDYTVTLHNGGSVSSPAKATLNVLISPAQVNGLTGTANGTVATFRWHANAEPDITSYQITSSSGDVVSSAHPAKACGRSHCSTTVALGPAAAHTTQQFAVRAVRCGQSCHHGMTGPSSAPASVTFGQYTRPTPTPSPTPTPTGGTGSTGGGSTGVIGIPPTGPVGESPTTPSPLPTVPVKVSPPAQHKAAHQAADLTGTKANSAADAETKSDIDGGLGASLWRGVAAAAVVLLIILHLAWATRARRT